MDIERALSAGQRFEESQRHLSACNFQSRDEEDKKDEERRVHRLAYDG